MTQDQNPSQKNPASRSQWKRGVHVEPANRFASSHTEAFSDGWDAVEEEAYQSITQAPGTQYLEDRSKSILSRNDSPDIPFTYSINPYRGCEHACTYCYARPTHEWLGMSAGKDFETKIMVKKSAAALLRKELQKPSWQCEPINFSGVTDCYQAAEKHFRLTRACLEVLWEARHPAVIVTKSVLILRDRALLAEMAAQGLAQVFISLTSLDGTLSSRMEPGASPPTMRLQAIRALRQAGVPVGVLMAPIVPGLTDAEIPALLAAAKAAGAQTAGYVPLRLPYSVKEMFIEWVRRAYPERAARVEARIRDLRDGALNDASFATRMRGKGILADHLNTTFHVFAKRLGLDGPLPAMDVSLFRRPPPPGTSRSLFDD